MKNTRKMMMAMLMLVAMMGMGACEKAVLDDENESGDKPETEGNVIIRASLYDIVPFDTRAVQNIADYCTHLQFVVFQDGNKMKGVNQKKGDADYGQVSMTLSPATYQLLIVAHSSTSNPTVTDPTKIQFTNQTGYSDTFCYYGDLVVNEGENSYDVRLQRATSMVRLTITDEIPSNVKTIRLSYEGESGVLNATTCMGGATNSKQNITYNVEGYQAPLTLGAYTFMRGEEGTLKMTVTAYDANSNVVVEKQLNDIPLKYRMVTEYSGNLFSVTNTDISLNLTAETEWQVYKQLTF